MNKPLMNSAGHEERSANFVLFNKGSSKSLNLYSREVINRFIVLGSKVNSPERVSPW